MSAGTASRGTDDRRLVLVLNAGSSTLKGSVVAIPGVTGGSSAGEVPADEVLAREAAAPRPRVASLALDWGDDASRRTDVPDAVAGALAELERQSIDPAALAAVAHRVVHGGPRSQAVVLDDDVLAEIEALAPLAPLHNPVAAAVIRAALGALPNHRHVAAFDTAFHATLPESAWRYPVPSAWEGWGIRRYGFHGLSASWAVQRAAALLGRPSSDLGLIVAHLGSGCSVTAVRGGTSVATSMGLTPLEGLMMGTRAGSIDPGILLAVLRDGRRGLAELADDLDHRAGLLGVSNRSAGIRELEVAADSGDGRAALAITMFVDRAAAGIAAIGTSLPRLDAVVFTGGIGEHAGWVRARIVARLGILGLAPVEPGETGADRVLEPAKDGRAAREASRLGRPTRAVALRIEAREDVVAGVAALAVVDG